MSKAKKLYTPEIRCEAVVQRTREFCGKPAINLLMEWDPAWGEIQWWTTGRCSLHTKWAEKKTSMSIRVVPITAAIYEHNYED